MYRTDNNNGSTSNRKIKEFVWTGTDISRAQINNDISFNINGAGDQIFDCDFTWVISTPNQLTWDGLKLEGQMITEDIISIEYSAS